MVKEKKKNNENYIKEYNVTLLEENIYVFQKLLSK